MVMRYAHHHPESLRRGVEALDKVSGKFITILAHANDKGATLAA